MACGPRVRDRGRRAVGTATASAAPRSASLSPCGPAQVTARRHLGDVLRLRDVAIGAVAGAAVAAAMDTGAVCAPSVAGVA